MSLITEWKKALRQYRDAATCARYRKTFADSMPSTDRLNKLLGRAMVRKKFATAAYLLEAGANPHSPYHYPARRGGLKYEPHLYYAARTGSVEGIDVLVKGGADVNKLGSYVDGSELPLHVAVNKNQKAAVIKLLEAGADPAIPTQHGSTALSYATSWYFDDIAKVITDFMAARNNPPAAAAPVAPDVSVVTDTVIELAPKVQLKTKTAASAKGTTP